MYLSTKPDLIIAIVGGMRNTMKNKNKNVPQNANCKRIIVCCYCTNNKNNKNNACEIYTVQKKEYE